LRETKRTIDASALQVLVDSLQDYAIFLLDVDGRVATWNPGAERIKRYASDEIIGTHFSVFYPPEDVAAGKPARLLEIATRDGHVEDAGWRLRKDGTRFWAHVVITALFDPSGTLIGFGKVTRDLTLQRQHEEQTRESEERFRLLVQEVTDYAIFMLDPNGDVMSWNAGAERFKGYKAEEIIGRHFSTFYTDEDKALNKPERELETARREGRAEDEGWRVRKDGTRFWANVVITAIRDSQGVLRGFGKVTRDLTERKKAEEARTRFIANAAHELRTPLSVIVGMTSYFESNADVDPATLAEHVEVISRQARRMHTLVNNLLDLTQLEQGRMSFTIRSVPLRPLVERTVGLSRPNGDHMIEIDVGETPVLADPMRLEQVVINLLLNAYRYGGKRISITSSVDGPRVRLMVEDDGPGVPPEQLAEIFEPFRRGKSNIMAEGSGLGLAITRSLVEAFGGKVWAEDPGSGIRFTVELQLADG
jgi:PAS domain S-box-containing protein